MPKHGRTRPMADNKLQEAIMRHVVIKPSKIPGAGKGAFWQGSVPLPAGLKIGVYTGLVLSKEPEDTTYCLGIGERTYIQATGKHSNWTAFMNDGTGSKYRNNCIFTATGRVQTVRDIMPGSEILVPYGRDYWAAHPKSPSK